MDTSYLEASFLQCATRAHNNLVIRITHFHFKGCQSAPKQLGRDRLRPLGKGAAKHAMAIGRYGNAIMAGLQMLLHVVVLHFLQA